MSEMTSDRPADTDIAIIGMAAHLPGAAGVADYWRNLRDGVESIRRLSREELLAAGELPHLIDHPDYVAAAAPLDGFEQFDADFFGLSPKEAAIMDPQHRQFLEVAWQALEDAAHPPESFPGRIGVFGGSGQGTYYWVNLRSHADLVDDAGVFLLRHTGNDKDVLTTRVSHLFDLRGPSVNVQTACSTSLVAVHYAIRSLLAGECDMALAGGVSLELPQLRGYLFKEGEVLSPDGHCHAFDHRAKGTVFSSGAGCVVLRRLADAIADGDDIRAVIRGSAVNNDGAAKAGYLAPSVDGQADAIAGAHAAAGIGADTIDYVECHGTGTYLGDPIEVAALTEAFRRSTDRTGFCRIGSVKTNIGHTDTAAGAASLIKTVLALQHRQIPPSLGYEKPNPAIPFDGSPFAVADRLLPWPERDHPPRAGVNSLGVGGTNAHVVLEAAPERAASDESDWPFQIITLSARSKAALDDASARLAAWLRANPEVPLADVAWTLQAGRRAFDRRRVLVAETAGEAAAKLEEANPRRVFTHQVAGDAPQPVFMFPGIGAQYAGMARDLYETEPTFRDWMDRGLAVLAGLTDADTRALWLPEPGDEEAADKALLRPSLQTPLIMIVEYALAQLWMEWGVQPAAFIGHSMGENTAAALAGVLSFEDCIALVHLRGQVFDDAHGGRMLSVPLSAEALAPYLVGEVELASDNAPGLCVATGPEAAMDDLAARLKADGIETRPIAVDVAAHSRALEPHLDRFHAFLSGIALHPPRIPVISNRTGDWLTDAQATDPGYWVAHLRHTVQFRAGLTTLSADPNRIYIEVGPGHALASLAGQHGAITPAQVVSTLRHPADDTPDDAYFLSQLGRVWACGGAFDWGQIWGDARRNRVALPTYPFQRRPYFIAPAALQASAAPDLPAREADLARWGWVERWKPAYADCDLDPTGDLADLPPENWLILADKTGHGAALADRLRAAGQTVAIARPGDTFARTGTGDYLLAPEEGQAGYDALLSDLAARGRMPQRVVHMWLVTRGREVTRPGSRFFHEIQELGFWSLTHLARAMAARGAAAHVLLVTNGARSLRGEALPAPEKATAFGPARIIPRDLAGMTVAMLDIDDDAPLPVLLAEALAAPGNTVAAWRGATRFERGLRPHVLPEPAPLPEGPVLVTGGAGTIGPQLARALAAAGRQVALATPEGDGGPDGILCLAADPANVDDMRRARAAAEAAFGPLAGLVHAAGAAADLPLGTAAPADLADALAPAVMGAEVIAEIWPDGDLQWLALCAATAEALAPAGQAARAAADACLAAIARARTGSRTRATAIDWAALQADPATAPDARARHVLAQGIREDELAEAFLRAMAAGTPQIALSPLALDRLAVAQGAPAPATAPAPAFDRPDLDGDYIAPEGAVETRLAAIWADLLGVAQVGAEDSFFDLGGHSLVAVRLFAAMKRLWGVDLPISVLFEAPTIRRLAALVGPVATPDAGAPAVAVAAPVPAAAAARFTHVVPIHPGGSGTPFFIVGGMFGNVLNLRHLAQGLGHDRPVWGLQARGLFGEAPPHETTAEAASDMIAEMRQVHSGPWMVGGYSGGGITAYEIAQQLHRAGETVAAVVLLDTRQPQPRPLSLRDRVAIKLIEMREEGIMFPLRWYARRRAWRHELRNVARDPESPAHFHNAAIEAAFMRAIGTYRVEPWAGPLALLRPPLVARWQVARDRAISDERAYLAADNEWGRHAPALEVIEVPGDHMTIVLEPHVRVVAARLAQVLAAADPLHPDRQVAAE
ncbi:MAG: acyltransferase domain-containing protein [Rubellimicrobium sp.]|nr:acyltransferase domain-containing protein [Rubellimicrobium sp.]